MECSVFQHVSDDQWNLVRPLIPRSKPSGRDRRTEMRSVVDAIRYLTTTNCSWRSLPENYPPWRTVYGYFRQWKADGIWPQIESLLAENPATESVATVISAGESSRAAIPDAGNQVAVGTQKPAASEQPSQGVAVQEFTAEEPRQGQPFGTVGDDGFPSEDKDGGCRPRRVPK